MSVLFIVVEARVNTRSSLYTKISVFIFTDKGPFTVSVKVSVSVRAVHWVQCRLLGPFTVSVSININAKKWVLHPKFSVSVSGKPRLLNSM